MTEFRIPMHQGPPHRKPLPNSQHGFPYQPYDTPRTAAPHSSGPSSAHSRTRTTSSHVLPYAAGAHSQQSQHYHAAPSLTQQSMAPPMGYPPSRRMSSTTTSTTSTGNQYMHADPDIRRSASNRSANSQLGYVALMRRQKATVWCDRVQPEDARARAQALRDKKRAYLEVHGSGRPGTLNSGKIRHGTKTGLDFSPSNLVGAKVPVRLSANEVGDGDEEAHSADGGAMHRRTGSGRSSLGSNRGSNRYPSGYQRTQGTMGSNSSPPNEKTDLPGVSENSHAEVQEEENFRTSSLLKDDTATSHSSEIDDFVGDMEAPISAAQAATKAKKAADLRRRGSVDERTTSMTNVRLFVANPDLSD